MKKIFFLFILMAGFFMKAQTVSDTIFMSASQNPFADRTLVSYTLTTSDTISVKVYNQVGSVAVTLRNNFIAPAGSYQDTLIMGGFNDGIYLVIIESRHHHLARLRLVKDHATGIPDVSGDVSVTIYPNPAKNQLHVEFTSGIIQNSATLRNALAQIVYQTENISEAHEIDLEALEAGIYFLHIDGSSKHRIFKIIKE